METGGATGATYRLEPGSPREALAVPLQPGEICGERVHADSRSRAGEGVSRPLGGGLRRVHKLDGDAPSSQAWRRSGGRGGQPLIYNVRCYFLRLALPAYKLDFLNFHH